MKKKVLFGFLGTDKDQRGPTNRRLMKWRPTVALAQIEDIKFDRFTIFYNLQFEKEERIEEINELLKTTITDFKHFSSNTEVVIHELLFNDPWDFHDVYDKLLAFAQNYRFDFDNEEYYIHIATGTHICQICLFLLNKSGRLPGKIIQTIPPKDRKLEDQSVGSYKILDTVAFRPQKSNLPSEDMGNIIGKSKQIKKIHDDIAKAAKPSKSAVLILGESGVGKELVAKAIHFASARKKKPFVALNCAAISASLVESELFGHEKGAFTGATQSRDGKFKVADHGTLFLDEIGEMKMELQAKFLRVLQEESFEPVGSNKSISVDVRIIAATNRNLEDCIRQDNFRQDLFYRLNVVTIEVPPLRERPDDIPDLAKHFLKEFNNTTGKSMDVSYVDFTAEALDALMSYSWPGNVRELRNAIERAYVKGSGEDVFIQKCHLELKLPNTTDETAVSRPRREKSPSSPDITHDYWRSCLCNIIGEEKVKVLEESDKVTKSRLNKFFDELTKIRKKQMDGHKIVSMTAAESSRGCFDPILGKMSDYLKEKFLDDKTVFSKVMTALLERSWQEVERNCTVQ